MRCPCLCLCWDVDYVIQLPYVLLRAVCYFYCVLLPLRPECNVISLYVMCCTVNGSVILVSCVFVNYLVKKFAIFLVWLLLNVMEVLRVGGGAVLDRLCMVSQRMCVLCL